jgi:NAD(P)-dependent dehydrogenase (short-subunit alcohol dehydrogenase family)
MNRRTGFMSGKVCLVTGATAGIGEVTARELARQGATVVIVSRNLERCESTVGRIRRETGNPNPDFLVADLSSQAKIRCLAEDFKQRYQRLDVLVNNAGAFYMKRQESGDGIEMTFALDHLNYYLLTLLLLDVMEDTAPARIVNVSSDAHRGGQIRFDDLNGKKHFSGWGAYSQAKLANVLFTYELDRRLRGKGITVNALHPGFVATRFAKNNGVIVRASMSFVHLFARTPEQGARTSIYLASSRQVEGVSGRYFVDERPVRSSPETYDQAAAHRLWQVSAEMVGM